jgi:acyl-CoA thioesterase FadM
MRLRFRLCLIIMKAFCKRKGQDRGKQSSLRLRVMPWDCVWRLSGNDRYHAFMDLGRIDLAIQMGWDKAILKNNWRPFVAAVHIWHSHPLKCFDPFVLHTRLLYCGKYAVWLEHIFESKGRKVATAISKNVAISGKTLVPVGTILPFFNEYPADKGCLDNIDALQKAESVLRQVSWPQGRQSPVK